MLFRKQTRKYLLIRLTRTCSYLNFPRISDQSKDPYDIANRRERLGNLVGLYDLPVFSCFFLESFLAANDAKSTVAAVYSFEAARYRACASRTVGDP